MYHFNYVSKALAKPYRRKIEKTINEVQNLVRKEFTFMFFLTGSAKRKLITYDVRTNKGFDFDYDIVVNCDHSKYSPEKIKRILFDAFQKAGANNDFSKVENSKRVISLKMYENDNNGLLVTPTLVCGADIAIVIKNSKGIVEKYLNYDKSRNVYSWEIQPKDFDGLEERIEQI
ncbi:MAG: hypothetical protein J5365_01175, partial [Erysipelotrichaceae bacterium]|nr:hypothetical protein [Erysipelotrichaceae bacterium]